jgi:hypothetical protein
MRQQVFEFLRAPAQKLPVTLEDAVQQELLRAMAELVVAVWKAERSSADERRTGKR